MKRPLLAPLIGLILGISLAPGFLHQESLFIIVGLAALLILAGSVWWRFPMGVFLASLFLFLSLGYGVAAFSLLRVEKNSDLLREAGEEKIYWVGRVTADCESDEEGGKVEVEILSFRRNEEIRLCQAKVLLKIGEGVCPFQRGDVIQSHSALRRPDRFKNEGSFDYPFFLLTRGITATTFAETHEFVVKVGEEKGPLLMFLQTLREKTQNSLSAVTLEEDRQILAALLLGEKQGLSQKTQDLFRRTGTTHLLVVSGLHLVMVGGVFYLFFRVLLSLWPPWLLRISARKWALFLSIIPITAYAALVGFSPSVLRATITVFLLGVVLLFSRERDALSLLILAAFSLLIVQPLLLFDLSFQLSFLSVASIVILVPRWEGFFLQRNKPLYLRPWIRRPLEVVLASVAVQVGLLPVLIFRFHQVSLTSLPANLVLVPAFSLVLMPLGLLGMFFSWVFPPAAHSLFTITAWCLKPFLAFLEFLATRPGSFPYIPGFTPLQILFYFALLFVFLFPLSRRLKGVCLSVLFLLNLLSWLLPPWFDRRDESLRLILLDVGQGDAILLRLPHGKRILVDGGGMPYSSFDVGEKVLNPYFFSKNFWRVDTVAMTHPHPDHYGGLRSVIRAFRPKEFWWNGESVDAPPFREFLNEVKEQGLPMIPLNTSTPPFEIEGVAFEILYPPAGGFPETRPDGASINNRSLVLRLTYRGLSFLLAGDIQKETEEILLQKGSLTQSFVLKVPHHGSDTSSTEAWVKAVCPRVGLIGVGRGNRYRFPRDEVLRRYEMLGTQVFRTDQDGEINVKWDGRTLAVTSFGGREVAWRLDPPSRWPASQEGLCYGSSSGSSSDFRP